MKLTGLALKGSRQTYRHTIECIEQSEWQTNKQKNSTESVSPHSAANINKQTKKCRTRSAKRFSCPLNIRDFRFRMEGVEPTQCLQLQGEGGGEEGEGGGEEDLVGDEATQQGTAEKVGLDCIYRT